ncbi:MAG: AarF/ABC1/UbiB kinase family protein [Sulfurospirillum sp.]|nr:MAG: AarF/ABC1/UbiB kinase family protein [Sulfurospirillum sp.]
MSFYHPGRIKKVFRFLLTIFLLIKKREHFLLMYPLSPEALTTTIQQLGASYIKLAQVLATRADFFEGAYLEALKTLHDEIPPMPQKDFHEVFARAFPQTPFSTFEEKPIASASIGEVHAATLKSGEKVAVKLRRNAIEKQVAADIRILRFFNRLFRPLFSYYTKNSVEAVIEEFAAMITQEVDFTKELENLQSFSRTYADSGVIFPKPYVAHCSEDAIVMSFEEGYRFDDRENLSKLGIRFEDIMGKLIYFYTEQMLINGYFHADPHPGNLLIDEAGNLILLDFGMVKKIPNLTRIAIIELIKSANERDFELYITACKRLGIVAHDAPDAQLQELAERMFEIFGNENLDAASMQKLAFDLLASMKDLPFKLPQEAIYMLRASAIIEGLGTTYIENFNGVKDILPILQRYIPRALGGNEKLLKMLRHEVTGIPLTVRRLKKVLTDLSENALQVHMNPDSLDLLVEKQKKWFRPIGRGLLLIVSAFFMLMVDRSYTTIAITLFTTGVGYIFLSL